MLLEGMTEGGVQKKISDFTNSNLNRKRPLSPEEVENDGAKKLNKECNINLVPLGTRPSSCLGNNSVVANFRTTSPVCANGTEHALISSPSHDALSSYASVTSGAPASNNNVVSQIQNKATRPHEASASALAFEPTMVQLCDALTNNKVDNLGHIFYPLVKYIENATRLIDSQVE